jgi:sporulation protein YlmC with PRC-barrel domain
MMKHRHWPKNLALSAIAAAFAAPLAHAQVGNSNAIDRDSRVVMSGTATPAVDSSGAVVERTLPFVPFPLTNLLDVVKGNDVRDARDSTILRNDVRVPDPSMPAAYAGYRASRNVTAAGGEASTYSGAATAPSEPVGPTAMAAAQTDTRTDATSDTRMDAAAADTNASSDAAVDSDASRDTRMDVPAADTAAGAAMGDTAAASGDTPMVSESAAMGRISRASEVIGAEVRDPQGKELGEIKDLVLDPGHGRIRYAVLSFGGFMGMGDKLFAVPWDSLQPAADGKYVLDVPHDQLRAAQGFDEDKWPDMAEERWHTETYRHYGQEPYWTASDVGTDPNAQDTAAIVGGPRGVGGGPGGGGAGGGAGAGGGGGGAGR